MKLRSLFSMDQFFPVKDNNSAKEQVALPVIILNKCLVRV
jgi:hypothetical protein